MFFVALYFAIGAVWMAWALAQQKILYPETSLPKFFFVGALNYVGWPICMWIAKFNDGKVRKFFEQFFV